ncbi:uncharacterized protein LOC143620789 [Bidens hawaiensis]|uniref:uncharacterized protein LOC143620789 n=1 Tax=Bidens hawaiensis TaxID=980011 RepID=UPI00404AB65C
MQQKRKFFWDVNRYVWDDPFLFKIGGDRILKRCVTKEEGWDILKHVHEGLTGGHYGANATAQKWVEAQALATNDERVVVRFLKKLFTHFGTPRAIISDRGIHFCNTVMEKALACYGVTHHSLGTTSFMLDYGKSCHLPVELEHRAYWALKTVNVDLTEAARKRYFQIHELEELRDAAYSRSLNIKEKLKALHDRQLKGGMLRSKWTGPYLVKEVFPYGVVELENPDNGTSWKVNGHRLKHYLGVPEESIEMEETPLDPLH